MANLKLRGVRGVGTKDERVWMEAVDDVDLGNYIVTDTTYDDKGNPSNKWRHVFEFSPKQVKKGEFVCLHSKAGVNCMGKTNDSGAPIHRIYWGLGERVWNNTGDRAHLIFAPRNQRQSVLVPEAE